MKWLVTVVSVLSAMLPDTFQERPRVPADSVQIEVIGCLKGRLLRASDVRNVDTQSGPDVRSRSFRLAGKREVMDDVKQENGHAVEVTGLVKRSALDDRGVKVGGRVEIGGGPPVSRSGIPSAADTVPVMDVLSIRRRSTSCGG
jgi:hypothetical protein